MFWELQNLVWREQVGGGGKKPRSRSQPTTGLTSMSGVWALP